MLWSAVGRFGTMAITFVSNMVLARLLTPKDFGCIGMLHIFIAISEVFVIGGFGAALIQKKILLTLITQRYFIGICW